MEQGYSDVTDRLYIYKLEAYDDLLLNDQFLCWLINFQATELYIPVIK